MRKQKLKTPTANNTLACQAFGDVHLKMEKLFRKVYREHFVELRDRIIKYFIWNFGSHWNGAVGAILQLCHSIFHIAYTVYTVYILEPLFIALINRIVNFNKLRGFSLFLLISSILSIYLKMKRRFSSLKNTHTSKH